MKRLCWEDTVLHSQTLPVETLGASKGSVIIPSLIFHNETVQTNKVPKII